MPHPPLAPSDEWKGKSEIGVYGDYVMQMDAAVGQLMATRDECGIADDTLVIFTSDNGCAPYIGVNKIEAKGHFPSGPYRGYKSDIWEGGHRVPFFARWPGVIAPGSTTKELICLTSLMATCADILGTPLPDDAGEDSFSILPVLKGDSLDRPTPPYVVHHSFFGGFAIREGDWKLVYGKNSMGWTKGGDNKPTQLYNMVEDYREQNNLTDKMPEKATHLMALLKQSAADGRSTPGPKMENDVPVELSSNKAKNKKKSSK